VLRVDGSSDAQAAIGALRNILASDDLSAAADLVDDEFPSWATCCGARANASSSRTETR